MKKLLIVILIFISGSIFLSVTGFFKGLKHGLSEGMAEGLYNGFKTRTLENCIGKDTSPDRKLFCECSADEIMAKLTLDQIRSQEAWNDVIINEITPICNKKIYGD